MADYTARLDLRVSVEQRERLDWLAEYLGLNAAAVARAWLDGNSEIDGVDLTATLFRLSQAAPGSWTEAHVQFGSSPVGRARAREEAHS
jgi:hypothetical protein